ncbi:acyl-CoA dehydrogenase family protein [Agilicoccus flavus]|uniref:acyl-CoA dehydrogenase family protein n=1 Tax=Agilicoccus flavus TaxID=2775968 RepID=UPI001CF6A131|nr:acyl-CoA dehydrogenase [Agilicoccus flavus]
MSDVSDVIRETLDGPWARVRERARTQTEPGRFGPPEADLPIEEYRARVHDQLLDLASLGFAGLGLSADQEGTDQGASVTAFEMIGHGDLSLFVKAGVQWGLFGGAVAALGTARHHELYLEPIAQARLLGCFAMTETGHGSDVQSLRTTITHDPATDELVVHTPDPSARKDYIGNAARDGRLAAVFGQLVTADGTGHGVHCVLVPIRDEAGAAMPGVLIGDCGGKAGLPGVDNGRLTFDHVRVPRANLLDRYGSIDAAGAYSSPIASDGKRFFTMLGTLVRGRITVGAAAGSATRNALTLAVVYGLARRQFAGPDGQDVVLLDYRAHQRKLLPALARSYALMLAQNELTAAMHEVLHADERADRGGAEGVEGEHGPGPGERDRRRLETRAAALKVANTSHASATIQTCREACGGAGYLSFNRLGKLRADTDVFTTFEGDNTVLLQLVGKSLLTAYADQFEAMNHVQAVAAVARQAGEALLERTISGSLVQRLVTGSRGRDADDALRDRGGQLDLFTDRERHVLETLAGRVRRARKDDPHQAWETFNDAQEHVLEAARAHIDRILLEAFAAAVDSTPAGPARDLLDLVGDLYAASTIEANRAWYLEHGRMSPEQAKDLTRHVDDLLVAVRPHVRTLVDAFAIPREWLVSDLLDPLTSEEVAASVSAGPAT